MVEVLEFRKRIKDALSVYRGSWVELGRLLNECACGGDYKDWGYDDFATYCARELGLKKATIQKLMVSYSYMKRHAVEKLQDIESGKDVVAPACDTVALLDKLHRTEGEDAQNSLSGMTARVFGDAMDESAEQDVRRRLRQCLAPAKQGNPDAREKAAILGTARKLRKAMSASHFVPDGLKERIEEPLAELEALA